MDYPLIFPSAFGKRCTGDKVGNLSQICSKTSRRFSPLFMGSFKRIASCFLPRTTGDWPQAWGIHYMRLALKFLKDRRRVFSSVYLICSSLLDETQDTLWKFIETSVSCSLRGRLRFFFFKHTLAKVLSLSHLPDWISIISQAAITFRCLRFICLGIL